MAKKWIQSADVIIDDATGALLVELNGPISADVINADFYAVTGGNGGDPGTGGKTLSDIDADLLTTGIKVATLPSVTVGSLPNVTIGSMPSVVIASGSLTASLDLADAANLASAKADLDAMLAILDRTAAQA